MIPPQAQYFAWLASLIGARKAIRGGGCGRSHHRGGNSVWAHECMWQDDRRTEVFPSTSDLAAGEHIGTGISVRHKDGRWALAGAGRWGPSQAWKLVGETSGGGRVGGVVAGWSGRVSKKGRGGVHPGGNVDRGS